MDTTSLIERHEEKNRFLTFDTLIFYVSGMNWDFFGLPDRRGVGGSMPPLSFLFFFLLNYY